MRSLSLIVPAALWLAIPSMTYGVVNTIDAEVSAEVKEFKSGAPVNSDSAFKDLNKSTSTLPLVVTAQLLHNEQGGGASQVTFSDPTLSVSPDPNEFGLNVAAFSLAPNLLSYANTGHAHEQREITFLSSEIGAVDGAGLQAQSFFFIDGIIMIWGEEGVTNLDGTTVQTTLRVDRSGKDGADAPQVLEAQLTLTGQSDGTVLLSATGGLTADSGSLIDLSGAIPDLGSVHVLIIPNTAIPYTYNAAVGQAFNLDATLDGQIQTHPGTGASILLGVPLVELASLVNSVSGGSVGTQLQQALEAALSTAAPAKPLIATDKTTTVRVTNGLGLNLLAPGCGRMGAEMGIALISFVAIALTGTGRYRRKPLN